MKRTVCLLFAAVVLSLPALAAPFSLVKGKRVGRIVLAPDEPAFVELAARDLAGDVERITGRRPEVLRAQKPGKGDVFLQTRPDGRWEAYEGVVERGVLRLSGSDARGTMFAVYHFTDAFLGVDPLWYWNDAVIPQRSELVWKDVSFRQDSPSVRFRGWFINDEDLLTDWKISKGIRDNGYRYYKTVVAPEIMERIAEALVRCRMNLIIPASFLNVLNPPEKELADICARRGVYLSMHHIEPMGVSGYTFFQYWRARGKELKYSYFSEPEAVEEVWTAAARVWKDYPNVIWQLGMRGAGDRPMWREDASMPEDDANRAAIISGAMRRQVEILNGLGVPREGRELSTTLWGEGAWFAERGLLEIPENCTVVFADNSPGWVWQEDIHKMPRSPRNRYGVYYHHGLIGAGPHLAPLVPARKTWEMLCEAAQADAGRYAIFNVGNVREFTGGLDATARMLWDLPAFNPEKWMQDWTQRHYGTAALAWAEAYARYFGSLQIHPENKVPAFLDGFLQQRMRRVLDELETGRPPRERKRDSFDKALLTATSLPFPSREEEYAALCLQRDSLRRALGDVESLYGRLPEEERPFALATLVNPVRLMFGMSDAYAELLLAAMQGLPGGRAHLNRAALRLRGVVALGDEYCRGKWENWWRGCLKVNPDALCKRVEKLLGGPDYSALTAENHPRLFLSDADLLKLRADLASGANPQLTALHGQMMQAAKRFGLEKKPLSYDPATSKQTLLPTIRRAMQRIVSAAYAWRFTGEKKYLDHALADIHCVCDNMEAWNSQYFLESAEMALTLGIAYDWLLPQLDAVTREKLLTTLRTQAFDLTLDPKKGWFYRVSHNWNHVCNAGISCAALATWECHPERARELVEKSVASNPLGMKGVYAPDGASPEGPGYWAYASAFEGMMLMAFEDLLGTDFGLSASQGFEKSGWFRVFAFGNTGLNYNYADCGLKAESCSALWYCAWRFGRPGLVYTQLPSLERGGYVSDRTLFLSLVSALRMGAVQASEPRERVFSAQGEVPVAMIRSGWKKDDAYLGIKGGTATVNHAHMDMGSFVFEWGGVRWASEYPVASYNLYRGVLRKLGIDAGKLFQYQQDSPRWMFFPYRNHHHSTLVVDDALMDVKGRGELLGTFEREVECGATVDMTTMFGGALSRAVRSASIVNGRTLKVVDELAAPAGADRKIRWNLVTGADFEIRPDGIVLHKDGRSMRLKAEGARVHYRRFPSAPSEENLPVSAMEPPVHPLLTVLGFDFTLPAGQGLRLQTTLEPIE